MNYEKLSRGLRYYYDKNIIHKTAGKRRVICEVGNYERFPVKLNERRELMDIPYHFRYVYRFVCDLQGLLGYTPEEIHAMVAQQESAANAAATAATTSAGGNPTTNGNGGSTAASSVKLEND